MEQYRLFFIILRTTLNNILSGLQLLNNVIQSGTIIDNEQLTLTKARKTPSFGSFKIGIKHSVFSSLT